MPNLQFQHNPTLTRQKRGRKRTSTHFKNQTQDNKVDLKKKKKMAP